MGMLKSLFVFSIWEENGILPGGEASADLSASLLEISRRVSTNIKSVEAFIHDKVKQQ